MRTNRLLFLLLITPRLFTACQNSKSSDESFQGTWESIGYGKIIEIESEKYHVFDVTNISCLPAKEGNVSEFIDVIRIKNDTLSLKIGFNIYSYIRTKKLPTFCEQRLPESKLFDPVYNFEVFVNTYKENYAYFKRNNIDWDSLYSIYKIRITPKTTKLQLYLVLDEMLGKLRDNHGYVEPTNEVLELATRLKEQNEKVNKSEKAGRPKEYGDFEIADLVAKCFLDEELSKDSQVVKWGKLKNNVGYIQVNAMFLHADLNMSDSVIQKNGFVDAYFAEFNKLSDLEKLEAEVSGINKILDDAISNLSKTQYIILDVRFNGGGNDAVGLEILRRFNSQRVKVAFKKARYKNGYSKNVSIYLESSTAPYTNPLYILTSQQSASATDFMALASLQLDNVKRIGSHTNGALSDALEKSLPNGWYFSLSNEECIDINGRNYESVGIPVDYELNYPEDRQTFFKEIAANLERDKQEVLRAIKKLRGE